MSDMEKVANGLRHCLPDECTRECPYINDSDCTRSLMQDTLSLLKEQEEEIENLKQTAQSMMEGICLLKEKEPVKPKWRKGTPFCGNCERRLEKKNRNMDGINCPTCGKLVDWDA